VGIGGQVREPTGVEEDARELDVWVNVLDEQI
jgi:hypothetical protein